MFQQPWHWKSEWPWQPTVQWDTAGFITKKKIKYLLNEDEASEQKITKFYKAVSEISLIRASCTLQQWLN